MMRPYIEQPRHSSAPKTVQIKIAHLFIFLALFSALIAVFYSQANALYRDGLKKSSQAEEELMQLRQENSELESRITDLLNKLTRLNKLYMSSLKKTAARVNTLASDTDHAAQRAFEVQSTNTYLIQQNRNIIEQLQICQKKRLSSSCIETDPHNPAIVRETIR